VAKILWTVVVLSYVFSPLAVHAQRDRVTIPGNVGTITLDWRATQDRAGRLLIAGHVITYGGMSGYCRTVLLIETLDAEGRVVAQNIGFIPGYDDVYFEEPVRTMAVHHGVREQLFDRQRELVAEICRYARTLARLGDECRHRRQRAQSRGEHDLGVHALL